MVGVERVVVNIQGPKLSVRDRLFVEMYLTVGELEKISEYSAAFTLSSVGRSGLGLRYVFNAIVTGRLLIWRKPS